MTENLVQIQPRNYTSRSAVLAYKTCHYKRYLAYLLDGFGFVPNAVNLDLLNGSVIHKGLRHLFEHCRVEHPDGDFEEACIDEAVEKARELWEETLTTSNGVQLKSSDEYQRLDWILEEQATLWEGLIRAFAIHRLPAILDEYEILEVEREEVFEAFSPLVTFLGAADGLFRRKRDNKLVVLSIKSTSEFADVTERDILHDMQGVSESFLVQERLNRYWEATQRSRISEENYRITNDLESLEIAAGLFTFLSTLNSPPKVFAVQYEYLIKGQRRQDPYKSGIYKQQSFLCHPLMKDQITRLGFGQQATTTMPSEYKWQWGSGNPGKAWNKGDIWNDIGIKNWVNLLASGQVQPENGNPFDQILRTPDLIVRSEEEIQEWLVSTRFQEEQIVKHLEEIKEIDIKLSLCNETKNLERVRQELIYQYFDKNTQNCHDYYGKDCAYVLHCHGREPINDMVHAGNLVPRISHHEMEREEQIRQGFINEEK